MASHGPLVLDGISLLDFTAHVLDLHDSPSTLVVCGTREAFLEDLLSAHRRIAEQQQQHLEGPGQDLFDEEHGHRHPTASSAEHRWSVSTLRMLSTSRSLKLAFCADITHLRAYLATYGQRPTQHLTENLGSDAGKHTCRLLAILNPIQLHKPTSAFSAQGLNRTLSVAVEAAHHSESRLVIAECHVDSDSTVESDNLASEAAHRPPPNAGPRGIWDEEISILNVTTKSFGAGERGWVGRTVRIRDIAERWCSFQTSKASSSS